MVRTRVAAGLVSLTFTAVVAGAPPAVASHVFTTQWGGPGAGTGQFNQPYSVAVDPSGNVYVADRENDRVQKFDAAGAFLGLVGSGTAGTAEGQFNAPRGVAVDATGNLYVTEESNYRVQKFNSSGTFERMWGRGVSTGGPGAEICTAGCGAGTPGGVGIDGAFNGPAGVTTDAAGNVYVPDTGNQRVQVFNSLGQFLTKWGTFGSADGQFNDPYDAAVDAAGAIYVVDAVNARIQKFSSPGVFATKWGSSGSAAGQFVFSGGGGVAVDPSGAVFVADYANGRVQGFSPDGVFLEQFAGPGTANAAADIAIAGSGATYVVNRFPHNVQRFNASSVPGLPGPEEGALLPAPVLGQSVNASPLSGTVLVSLPPGAARAAQVKGRRFVPLEQARQLPVGSLLDTRKGKVRLTSAKDTVGNTQSGDFASGIFQVLQSRRSRARGLTELVLKGSSFRGCSRAASGSGASASARRRLSRRTVRRLRADANGRFRSRGRHSSATVRGTVWLTIDRCDGTLTKVKRGKVAVRDFRKKRTVVVKAGKRYLAAAPGR